MKKYRIDHLDELESEAIYVFREIAAQFERPGLLFSGGKDSICLVHLAKKAFHPGRLPFPLVHIDTGHNFDETLKFRDHLVEKMSERLIVKTVQESIDKGRVAEEKGPNPSRNALQSTTLLDAIESLQLDCAIGGGRRDEEKARAKERFFSHRDDFGQWNPQNQRPELWNLYNGRHASGEHFRVFPLSNWTELDVWMYIDREKIELPSLYFSHDREVVVKKDGNLLALSDFTQPLEGDVVETRRVRCRTIGDITCTGLTESKAETLEDIVSEIATIKTTERGGRSDDKRSESAMEDRKRQGYF